MFRHPLIVILLLALSLTGCSSDDDDDEPVRVATGATPTAHHTPVGARDDVALAVVFEPRARQVRVDAVAITGSGDLDAIERIALYVDVDGDGAVSPTDRQIASAAWSGDRVQFTGLQHDLPTNRSETWLVAADLRPGRPAGETFQLFIELRDDVTVTVGSESARPAGRFPLACGEVTTDAVPVRMTARPAAGSLQPWLRADEPKMLLPLQLAASAATDLQLQQVRLELTGTVAPNDLAGAWLYVDDGDGQLDLAADTLLAGPLQPPASGELLFDSLDPADAGWAAGESRELFLVVEVGAPVAFGETVGAELAALTDLEVVEAGSGQAVTVEGSLPGVSPRWIRRTVVLLTTGDEAYAQELDTGRELWRHTFGSGIDYAYIGSAPDGRGGYTVLVEEINRSAGQFHVVALDAVSGTEMWRLTDYRLRWLRGGARVSQSGMNRLPLHPLMEDELYFPDGLPGGSEPEIVVTDTARTVLEAVRISDGAILWTHTGTAVHERWIPDVNGDGEYDVLANRNDDETFCLDGTNGQPLWVQQVDVPAPGIPVPDQDGDGIYDYAHGLFFTNYLFLRSGADGSEIWSRLGVGFDGSIDTLLPLPGGGYDLVSCHQSDVPMRLDLATGQTVWSATQGPGFDSSYESARLLPLAGGGYDIIHNWRSNEFVGVLDADTGVTKWTVASPQRGFYSVVPDENGDGQMDVLIWDASQLAIHDATDGAVIRTLPDTEVLAGAVIP